MNTKPTDLPEWAVDAGEATGICAEFIKAVLEKAGLENLVVGLSGGIDSAVAAGLAVRTLGKDRVRGFMMPYATSNPDSERDAVAVADTLGIEREKVDITPMADAFMSGIPADDLVRRGNIMARCRMVVLFDRSARDQALVLGTGNRTEALLGYTTIYGDNACGLNPLGLLYKTEVRLLARHLGLPDAVLDKAPSADLWSGQADEDELGFTYAEADRILHLMVDEGLEIRQMEALNFDPKLVERVLRRMRAMAFKRLAPPVAEFPGRPDPDSIEPPASFTDGGFH